MEVISVVNVFGFGFLKLTLHEYYKKSSTLNIRAASFSKGDPF